MSNMIEHNGEMVDIDELAKSEREEAHEAGKLRGFGIGQHTYFDMDAGVDIDEFVGEVVEAEMHSRDFSPFEFIAHRFNSLPEPIQDEVWDAWDEGVADGARAYIRGVIFLYDVAIKELNT